MEGEEIRKNNESEKFATHLTVEEVKMTKGFENMTELEIREYIESVRQYCIIIYKLFVVHKEKSSNIKKLAA